MCYGIPVAAAEYALFRSIEYTCSSIYNGIIYLAMGCPPAYDDVIQNDNYNNIMKKIDKNDIKQYDKNIVENNITNIQPPAYETIPFSLNKSEEVTVDMDYDIVEIGNELTMEELEILFDT